MDTEKLVEFLGHSSIYDPFDDFLLAAGIKKRPRETDSYPYKVPTNVPGLTLKFETSPEDKGMKTKSPGMFVFHEIYFDCESKKFPYTGPLPWRLDAARSGQAVLSRLAPNAPTKIDVADSGGVLTFLIDGIVGTFCYGDQKLTHLRFARFSLKDKYHVARGVVPA